MECSKLFLFLSTLYIYSLKPVGDGEDIASNPTFSDAAFGGECATFDLVYNVLQLPH